MESDLDYQTPAGYDWRTKATATCWSDLDYPPAGYDQDQRGGCLAIVCALVVVLAIMAGLAAAAILVYEWTTP